MARLLPDVPVAPVTVVRVQVKIEPTIGNPRLSRVKVLS
jgi:hypothetical protein